jgi:hypothetical protein
MTNEYPGDEPDDMPQASDDMPQEEQAALLVEPSFDHQVDDEPDLLRAEFGAPNEAGGYGRGEPS